jgi:CRISPR-associated protein Cas2
MADFLVAYDIKDNKRLAKFARRMEKIGIRIEYSLFFVPNISENEMVEIVFKLNELLEDEDDVRIYKVKDYGIALGAADTLEDIFILRK